MSRRGCMHKNINTFNSSLNKPNRGPAWQAKLFELGFRRDIGSIAADQRIIS